MSITEFSSGVNIFVALRDKDFQAGLNKAQGHLKAFAERSQTLGESVGLVASALPLAFTGAVKAFAEFDTQMRMVSAVSGATGTAFENLTQQAKRLGRETAFTAKQVAEGMLNLGRMGFSTDEIRDSIGDVMHLSTATGTDLAEAAQIASNTMRVFGLQASEMTDVVDMLSVTANGSAQTLTDLGEAMKAAGPHAARAGESLQDTLASLGVLANMGIRGSMAGNAIGRTLKQIADPKVAAMLESMGVSTTGADGNLRKLKDILVDIARVASTMRSGEQIAFFEDIFNARGSLAGGTLAGNMEAVDRMVAALDNYRGAAARVAEETEAGIGGKLHGLASAAEGVVLAIGQTASALGGPIISAVTSLLRGLVAIDERFPSIGKALMLFVSIPAVYGLAANATAVLTRAVFGLVTGYKSLASNIVRFFALCATNPTVLAFTAIAAAVAGVVILLQRARHETERLMQGGAGLRDSVQSDLDGGARRRAADVAARDNLSAIASGGRLSDADAAKADQVRQGLRERYGENFERGLLVDAEKELKEQLSKVESRRIALHAANLQSNTAESLDEEKRLLELEDSLRKRLDEVGNALFTGDHDRQHRYDTSLALPVETFGDLEQSAAASAKAIADARAEMEKMEAEETARGLSSVEKELREIADLRKKYVEQWNTAGGGTGRAAFEASLDAREAAILAKNRAGYGDFLGNADAEAERRDATRRMAAGFNVLMEGGDLKGAGSFVNGLERLVTGWRDLYSGKYAEFTGAGSEGGVSLTESERMSLDELKKAISAGMERVADFRNRVAEARAAGAGSGEVVRRSVGTYRADAFFRRAGLVNGADPVAERTAKATEESRRVLAEMLRLFSNGTPLVLT